MAKTVCSSLLNMDAAVIADQIDRDGAVEIPNVIGNGDVDAACRVLARASDAGDGGYVFFEGTTGLEGTFLADLPTCPAVLSLATRLCQEMSGTSSGDLHARQTVRVLRGETGQRESLRFHYDSFILTMIIPIAMPKSGPMGDLIMLPNHRPIRQSYALNVLDKVRYANPIAQYGLKSRHAKGALKCIRMIPGHAYLFSGYRTLHANDICAEDALRCTAVLHFNNPHTHHPLKRFLSGH